MHSDLSLSSQSEEAVCTLCPAMDPPLDGPGRKTITLMGDMSTSYQVA